MAKIKLSSGKPLPVTENGTKYIDSWPHTRLFLFLMGRPESIADDPNEFSSPWEDPECVHEGIKTRSQLAEEAILAVDEVPPDIVNLVLDEMLDSTRTIKPLPYEVQELCRAVLKIQQKLEAL